MKRKPPGRLEAGSDPDFVMMICTAGHVDHGKTSLVKHLTGCDTDRLKAEKERGLTIELGFAPCMLRGNLSVGIVDVPGHEKFIRNMVSGVPGIDLAILVIAADDGIMPQTIEHFQIMELLGVRCGIVALTKIDLVTKERVERLTEQIRNFLIGSFMADAPICPVSSETFEGIFDFHDHLVERIKGVEKKSSPGVFRMPIERVFLQKGFGIIASGIPLAGAIEVGVQIEIVPGHFKGRIKGIQRFGRNAQEGGYGQCLALNIPDIGKNRPARGQVVCIPGYLNAARLFHVRLKTVAGLERPLRNAEEIKFHSGTSEEPGKLFLLEDETLDKNKEGLATISLSKPLAAAAFDRFIIRRSSPAATVGGGSILAISHADVRPKRKKLAERLRASQAFFEGVDAAGFEGVDKRVEHFLRIERTAGASAKEISIGTLLALDWVNESLARLMDGTRVVALGGGRAAQADYFVHPEAYNIYLGKVRNMIQTACAEKAALSLMMSDLRRDTDWPSLLWDKILEDLSHGGFVEVRGNKVILKEASEEFDEADRLRMDKLLKIYEDTGFSSPRPGDLPDMLETTQEKTDRLLEHLCNEEKLVQLPLNVVLSYESFKRAQDMAVSIIKQNGALKSVDFKHAINSSRKYALAVLDLLDERRVTVCRDKHERVLAPDYERNLL